MASVLLSFGSFALGEASCHAMKTPIQPYANSHVSGPSWKHIFQAQLTVT